MIHRSLDDSSHVGLDPRDYDVVQAGAPLVYGWLRYGEPDGVGVVAEPEPGTPPEVEEWLDPLLRRWAESEGVELDLEWTPSAAWRPGD